MLSITLLILLIALCIFIAIKFSEMRFASGMILIFLIVFLVNSLAYERYRIPIGYFGIFNSSYSQVIKDLKATMNDPKSFVLVEFKTLYDSDTYALHYIRFSGTNAFGGTVTNSRTMYYYRDNNCASESVGSDFLSYFSGLSDYEYISTIKNRPMCRPQYWE